MYILICLEAAAWSLSLRGRGAGLRSSLGPEGSMEIAWTEDVHPIPGRGRDPGTGGGGGESAPPPPSPVSKDIGGHIGSAGRRVGGVCPFPPQKKELCVRNCASGTFFWANLLELIKVS